MGAVRCKRCDETYVRQSSRGGIDGVLTHMHLYRFRCQLCEHRFWLLLWRARQTAASLKHDKREYDRLPVSFPIEFAGDRNGEGSLRNLSIRGCSIETTIRPSHNGVLSLKLNWRGSRPIVLVEAAIVRSGVANRFGLEFLKMELNESQRLRALIKRLFLTGANRDKPRVAAFDKAAGLRVLDSSLEMADQEIDGWILW
jgi:PilZ domain-containing protein